MTGIGSGSGIVAVAADRRRRLLCPRDESGQILLLTIAYATLALLLLTAVVSATSVHLDRKAVLAAVDQAALAGATALDDGRYYVPSDARQARDDAGADRGVGLVTLTDASVRSAGEEHLSAASATTTRVPVSLVSAGTPDGSTAEVTLQALSRPALISWVTAAWSDGVLIEVTARARSG